MSKYRKTIETIKTVLILLLTINGLFLAWQTGLFSDYYAAFPMVGNLVQVFRGTTSLPEPDGTIIKEAARPAVIVITDSNGERFGVRNDIDTLNSVYDRTITVLSEGLGSAFAASQITEDEWRAALSNPGVYFEYIVPVRLSVLGAWLGTRVPDIFEDYEIRRLIISFEDKVNRIYFQVHSSGLYFSAETASATGKPQELNMYSPNGAMFAYETGFVDSEAPYMLIMPGVYHPNIRSLSVGSQDSLLDEALIIFGHYAEAAPRILSGDVLICVGTEFNISVFPDGRVVYRRTSDDFADDAANSLSTIELIERARAITADSVGLTSGDASVQFEAFEYDNGEFSVFFGYYIAGGRVYLNNDSFASTITFSSGEITFAELNFRNFTLTGEYSRLLPERQVFAAAGGEFILSYFDTGPEVLLPSWVRTWF